MSVINTQPLIGASGQGGGYNIARSLRSRASASAYLQRTPSSTTNQKTWTYSGWLKRGALGSLGKFANAYYPSGNTVFSARFETNDTLNIYSYNIGTAAFIWQVQTTQVFRDPSAYYHIMIVVDTTQATASNRLKIYVNGTQVTSFGTANYPAQNTNTELNTNGNSFQLCAGTANNSTYEQYYDGYTAELNFIDGQALTPSSFGETDSVTGVWKPKAYSGTYGTNGFYLKFTDVATTSGSNAGLGKDFSGNGNYWNTNNISVTSGSTYDSMKDVPTLTDTDTANYCVLNPLDATTPAEITNGNLSFGGGTNVRGTLGGFGSGKYYYEYTKTNASSSPNFGRCGAVSNTVALASMTSVGTVYRSDGLLYENDVNVATYASFTTNDVIGVAIDCDNSQISFYKNNTLQGTRSFPSGLTSSNVTPALRNNTGQTSVVNFGQRPFTYTPPTGYKALNTYNLPDSTIVAGNKHFDAPIWAGNSTDARAITGVNFQPGMVWIKNRTTNGEYHNLFDAVRGATKRIFPNDPQVENTSTATLQSFDSSGFTLGTNSNVNATSANYVGWSWKANGAGSTNTSGSITSTVSVNASAGFSIVTYTGTGSSATVGHGLGVAPKFIIYKARNSSSWNWLVNIGALTGTQGDYIYLNGSQGKLNSSNVNNANSTTFPVSGSPENNGNGTTYVAYCWAEIPGFSKFGTYVGNGSTDGAFVYTGFRPKCVIIKSTSNASDWTIWDTSRNPYNLLNLELNPNNTSNEYVANTADFLSNGFKMKSTYGNTNGSNYNYVYMAFAENPFKNALAR